MNNGCKGFSLIEVLVSSAVLVIVAVMGAQSLLAGVRMKNRADQREQSEERLENRIALSQTPDRRMERELTIRCGEEETDWDIVLQLYQEEGLASFYTFTRAGEGE